MTDEWRRYDVRDLIDRKALEIGDGYRAKNAELSPTGLPFARAGNIGNGFRFSDVDYLPEDVASGLGRKVSRPGDVVFTSKGTVGRCAFVKPDTPRFVYSPQLCYWRSLDKNLIDPRFLYYWMASHEFRAQVYSVSGQTDMAEYVSLRDQRRMHVTAPSIIEQRAIAHVLGALDDKIEVNGRMNRTLEAMARALFTSWFVDFEPVRAKQDGRDTGLPGEVAALFPNYLVDSAPSRIPATWRFVTLADVAISPQVAVDPTLLPDDTHYIGLEHVPRRSIALNDWADVGSVSSRKSAFKKGDILFGKLNPHLHKVGLAPVNGVSSTDILVIRAKSSELSAFILIAISSPLFVAYTSRTAKGTTMPRTGWKTMQDHRLCVPSDRVARAFNDAVSPMLDRIVKNVHESRTLAAVRDHLLPKLVSGQRRMNFSDPPSDRATPAGRAASERGPGGSHPASARPWRRRR